MAHNAQATDTWTKTALAGFTVSIYEKIYAQQHLLFYHKPSEISEKKNKVMNQLQLDGCRQW